MTRRYSHIPMLAVAVLLNLPFSVTAMMAQASMPVAKLPISALQKLAEAGDPAAENELGVRYRLGTDVPKDPAKAIPWFMKAARQGYATAYLNLGAAYYNDDGAPLHDMDSCVWFMLAADAGESRGQEAVERVRREEPPKAYVQCEVLTASAYLDGKVIKQDYGRAMQWYLKAADTGDGIACEKIAYLYDRGLGVAADQQESLKWLKRSADLGYGPAIYELGRDYELGQPVPADLERARKLYEQASSYDVPQAFAALGTMYAEGRGVKLDRQKALAYYIVAADLGDSDGKRNAELLAAQLSARQLDSAKEKALKLVQSSKRPVLVVGR